MSDAPKSSASIEAIIRDAASAEQGAPFTSNDLKDLADKVDLLTADLGKWNGYKAASVEYVTAFKTEIDWHRRIRVSVSVAAGIIVTFLLIMLMVGVRSANAFRAEHAHALTALIVGCITGSVVITIALVRGAFSNLTERNAGLPMPEHFKELIEATKGLGGNTTGH